MSNDQACCSLMMWANSSAMSVYDSYVVDSSKRGPQVCTTGRRAFPFMLLNVTSMDGKQIMSLPVTKCSHLSSVLPYKDLIYFFR